MKLETRLDNALCHYIELTFLNAQESQPKINQYVTDLELPKMQISPLQAKFLHFITLISGAKDCLELGTFCGYSALTIASALPKEGLLYTCDINNAHISFAKKIWAENKAIDKIHFRHRAALDFLSELEQQQKTFDLIFIDADKTNYLSYYLKAKTLLRHSGIIIIDNILWGGKVTSELNEPQLNGIKTLNTYVAQDAEVITSIVPVGDGLLLIKKK